jgi:hypothetical protein
VHISNGVTLVADEQLTSVTGCSVADLAFTTVNDDDYPDLIVVSGYDQNEVFTPVTLLTGTADIDFQFSDTFLAGSDPQWIARGRLTNDQFPDVAIGNRADNSISIMLGAEGCQLSPAPEINLDCEDCLQMQNLGAARLLEQQEVLVYIAITSSDGKLHVASTSGEK